MNTAQQVSPISELVSVLEVGMMRPFAMAKVRPVSLREHQTVLLREELSDIVTQSQGRVLLRFPEGSEISASGLSEVIRAAQRCEERHGMMVVVGLSKPMLKLMRATGLDRHLTVAKDTAAAMRYFDKRSAAAVA